MSLIGTLTSGVSAMRSFTKGLEVIGNNIANVNTTGYKGSTTNFQESLSNTLQGSAPSSGNNPNLSSVQVGTGVKIASINANFTQGALSTTGVDTDLGISGNGFFRVKNSVDNSEYVTRAGDFRIDDQGYLVTTQGYRVQGLTGGSSGTAPGTLGSIQLGTPPAGTQLQSYSFDRQGNMVEFYSDGSSATTNKLLLQNFRDPSALQRSGGNLFIGFDAAGPINGGALLATGENNPGTNGLGNIEAGTLELSNVDLTEQFANMITVQRSFQAASRIVTVSDSILEEVVNLKR
ncbi:MAG: flagellar hook-basal body complex protein [Opitutaceae bacterium]|jgi:flagellar hook protein FlgE